MSFIKLVCFLLGLVKKNWLSLKCKESVMLMEFEYFKSLISKHILPQTRYRYCSKVCGTPPLPSTQLDLMINYRLTIHWYFPFYFLVIIKWLIKWRLTCLVTAVSVVLRSNGGYFLDCPRNWMLTFEMTLKTYQYSTKINGAYVI